MRGVFQFGQMTILARLLIPDEFGLAASASAFISIGSILSDLGLNTALIQAGEITQEERSSLYSVNLISGFLMMMIFIALSPVFGLLMNDKRLIPIICTYSVVFLTNATGMQLRYDAERRFEFRLISKVEILSSLIGVIYAVIAARFGGGPYSLVGGIIAASIANSILNWSLVHRDLRPTVFVHPKYAKRFMSFGVKVIAGSIITQLYTNIDLFFGGRMMGATQLGVYAVPRNLMVQCLSLINPVVTRVGYPLIAGSKTNVGLVSRYYRHTVSSAVGVSAPIYLSCVFYGEDVVRLLFGKEWMSTVGPLQILAIWAMTRSILNPLGNLLLGLGRPGLGLIWNLVQVGLSIAVLLFVDITNAKSISIVVTSLMLMQIIPSWYFIVRPLSGLSFSSYLVAFIKPISIAGVAFFVGKIAGLGFDNQWMAFAVGISVSILIYVIISAKMNEMWTKVFTDQIEKMISKY